MEKLVVSNEGYKENIRMFASIVDYFLADVHITRRFNLANYSLMLTTRKPHGKKERDYC